MAASTNDKILSWIKKTVTEKFADDISLVMIYGSYINGTANERSDIDCYFVPKTQRGYDFAADFIIDGIGYDIFPMSWDRLENISDLNEKLFPCVGDVEIVFYSSQTEVDRFREIQLRLQRNLSNDTLCRQAAEKRLNEALSAYSNMLSCSEFKKIRLFAGEILMSISDSLAVFNHDYFHLGLKKQYEQMRQFSNMPSGISELYLDVIKSETAEKTTAVCSQMLKTVCRHYGVNFNPPPVQRQPAAVPSEYSSDYLQLARWYEEIISSFNKVYYCCDKCDYVLAFLSAVCLQNELDDVASEYGFAPFDILSCYKHNDLKDLKNLTATAEKKLAEKIIEGGGHIKQFDSFEQFFDSEGQ